MLQSRQHSDVEVCRFWGVPSILIGAGTTQSSAWPASFEQQVLSFLTFTLQSYVDEFETSFIDALVPLEEKRSITVEHDEADFIRMDSTAKANFLTKLTGGGLMTRNEGRAKLRLPKSDEEGADNLTIQSNMLLLELIQELANNGNTTKDK